MNHYQKNDDSDEYDFERNYLIDTLLTQQDIYAFVCEQLDF